MKLLPYILTNQQKKEFTVWKFDVFLSHGGKSIWEEEGVLSKSKIQEDYCEANDIFINKLFMDTKKQIAYIQIDTKKTKVSDFYTYDEACLKVEKPECWRSFYFIQDRLNSYWWSPKGLLEAEIQGIGNIQELFEECMSRSKDIVL
jgi:hypothetical protein